ncbi:DUF5997 family protein, partial [Streptomyces sp. NPDC001193]
GRPPTAVTAAMSGRLDALTTEQIDTLKQENPEWLQKERATQAEVRKEAVRIKEKHAEQAERLQQSGS